MLFFFTILYSSQASLTKSPMGSQARMTKTEIFPPSGLKISFFSVEATKSVNEKVNIYYMFSLTMIYFGIDILKMKM